jgi:hypothetical protein
MLTKDELLGASDLVEREVELPSIGEHATVRVRALPAAYSNQATSEALEMKTGARGEQTATVNTQRLEELQVLHGLIDPKLDTLDEVRAFSIKVGRAWRAIVTAIDEISGVDKAAIEQANARFRSGGPPPAGAVVGDESGAGDGGPDLLVPAGAGNAHAGR